MSTPATASTKTVAAFQDAAIEISRLLRDAKVDAPLRPKAMAAIMVALSAGGIVSEPRRALASLNHQVRSALAARGLESKQRRVLTNVLRLSGADFDRLAPYIGPVASVLENLNIRTALASDCDFLGIFYEAFLRYGYDNNALGIVFTPRHIARFCVELVGASRDDRVIDIACGTGGFLVAAQDAIRGSTKHRSGTKDGDAIHRDNAMGIAGFDTNPTVWALAALNMVFRGGAAASHHMKLGNCFDPQNQRAVRRRFTRAFLNPPFSQDAEPERDFINSAMETLVPGGRCAVVVKAGIFADEEHAAWRAEFVRRHSILGVISLPEEVFYPTAAPTSILLATAHIPQSDDAPVLMARVWNDGFEKLKNKRVERDGCELPEVKRCLEATLRGDVFKSRLAAKVNGAQMKDGAEWSPQEWLPQAMSADDVRPEQREVVAAIFRAVAQIPELADSVLPDFTTTWQALPPLPRAHTARVDEFFRVLNGKSAGEKHYPAGQVAYISSGGTTNSIVRLVEAGAEECFADGAITVTAFGQAAVQPWPFVARGNGGSSVRVLLPRYRMSFAEVTYFAAQINAQQWRFFYARMAIKSRLERLRLTSPPESLADRKQTIAARVRAWRTSLAELSEI